MAAFRHLLTNCGFSTPRDRSSSSTFPWRPLVLDFAPAELLAFFALGLEVSLADRPASPFVFDGLAEVFPVLVERTRFFNGIGCCSVAAAVVSASMSTCGRALRCRGQMARACLYCVTYMQLLLYDLTGVSAVFPRMRDMSGTLTGYTVLSASLALCMWSSPDCVWKNLNFAWEVHRNAF